MKVQTLGERRMRDSASWALLCYPSSPCMWISLRRLRVCVARLGACVIDRSYKLGFFACFHAISLVWNAVVSGNRHLNFRVGVVLKPLVSLVGHLVTCSSRVRVDRDRRTDDYRNPRCACACRGLIIKST